MEEVRTFLLAIGLGNVYGQHFEDAGYDDMSEIKSMSAEDIEFLLSRTKMTRVHAERFRREFHGSAGIDPQEDAADESNNASPCRVEPFSSELDDLLCVCLLHERWFPSVHAWAFQTGVNDLHEVRSSLEDLARFAQLPRYIVRCLRKELNRRFGISTPPPTPPSPESSDEDETSMRQNAMELLAKLKARLVGRCELVAAEEPCTGLGQNI